jgi:HAMP domain-containing protein
MQHGILIKAFLRCGRDECLSGLLVAAAGVQRAAMDRSLTRPLRAIAARKKQFAETNFSKSLEADMFNSITRLRFTLAMLVIAALTIAIYKAAELSRRGRCARCGD